RVGEGFLKQGKKAMAKVRRTHPAAYLKYLVLLVPREHKVEQSNRLKAMSDEELDQALAALRQLLADREAAAQGQLRHINIVRCLSLVDRHWEHCRSCVDRRFVGAVLPSISSTLAGCAGTLSHRYGRLRIDDCVEALADLIIKMPDPKDGPEELRVASVCL